MDEGTAVAPELALHRQGTHPARRTLSLLLLLAIPGGAQNYPQPPQPSMDERFGQRVNPGSAFDLPWSTEDERQLRLLNADRQKSMVADTNKLLKLARELDSEIAAPNADTPTPAQMRKVAEIEKLAHSVKEKMSTSVRGIPVFGPPIVNPGR
jgi:hypothetical protein